MAHSLTFDAIYTAWFHEVTRWIRALGWPGADIEDLAQEVFVVVERKLAQFDGANLPGWLYRITAQTVSDFQRRSWFRNFFRAPRVTLDEPGEEGEAGEEPPSTDPADVLDRREAQRLVDRLLRGLSPKLRETFVLFEIEGYSGSEIAGLHGIPEATVWTRLHLARKQFIALAADLKKREGL